MSAFCTIFYQACIIVLVRKFKRGDENFRRGAKSSPRRCTPPRTFPLKSGLASG